MLNRPVKRSKNSRNRGIIQVIQGVIAAMFGVRDHRKHRADFEKGDLGQFVATGIVMVVIFVLTIYWIVKIILAQYV